MQIALASRCAHRPRRVELDRSLSVTVSKPVTVASGESKRLEPREGARERVVVVGNGPVGWKFCDLLTSKASSRNFQVIAFGEEPDCAYDRVHLTSYLEHRSVEKLTLASRSWYEERGVSLITGDPVTELDTDLKQVKTRDGQTVFYDRLVLATGSRAFVPPIPGVDLPSVHVYRTVDDVERIALDMDRLSSIPGAKAAVLGGGLLGLEAARALHDAGIETHVYEMASVLMPRQLDESAAALLRREIEALGVVVHTLARTQAIEATADDKLALVLDDDETPEVFDTIVISAGIRPRDELARAGGIETHPRGGVVVSDKLETSEPNVFAIGECAVHNETVYGLVAPGYHMAGVVADRLTSRLPVKPTFRGHDNATRLKLLGVDVITLGDFLREDANTGIVVHKTESTYRKLIIKGTRVVGATIVGSCDELPRLIETVESRRRVGRRALNRFQHEGRLWKQEDAKHVSEWPAAAIVCSCMNVRRGTLTKACEAGCETVDCLIAKTTASTVCGSCRPLLAELVGSPETAGGVAGWRALGVIASISAVLVAAAVVVGAQDYAASIQAAQFAWDQFLLDDFWKQVTGYSLVGLSAVAASLSARKRVKKLSFGTYGLWRVFHSAIGLMCVFGLVLHTGMHLGANLNFALMFSFVGTLLVGGLTGIITSLESKAGKPPPPWVKTWRPRLTWAHVLFTWPLPVLVAFHILAFYMHAE